VDGWETFFRKQSARRAGHTKQRAIRLAIILLIAIDTLAATAMFSGWRP